MYSLYLYIYFKSILKRDNEIDIFKDFLERTLDYAVT